MYIYRIYFAKRDESVTTRAYYDMYETDDWGANLIVLQSKTRGFLFLDKQLFVAVVSIQSFYSSASFYRPSAVFPFRPSNLTIYLL